MKKSIIALALAAVSILAQAGACGYPPYPPYGTYPVCVCDNRGNCSWIFVSK